MQKRHGPIRIKQAYFLVSALSMHVYQSICQREHKEIIRINQQRWEIEENFRIMKTEFKARSVYVQRDDRIKAHFLTCYLSLLLYRLVREETRRGIYM